jgi:hypothetical protein
VRFHGERYPWPRTTARPTGRATVGSTSSSRVAPVEKPVPAAPAAAAAPAPAATTTLQHRSGLAAGLSATTGRAVDSSCRFVVTSCRPTVNFAARPLESKAFRTTPWSDGMADVKRSYWRIPAALILR